MCEKVKIDAVGIQIDNDKTLVTIEQAQKLRDQLNELFGRNFVEEYHCYYHSPDITIPDYVYWDKSRSAKCSLDILPNASGNYTAYLIC